MSVFSKLFPKKKLVEKQVGDYVVKFKCTDRHLELLDEILNCSTSKYEGLVELMGKRMSALESKIDRVLNYFEELSGGDFGKIVASAKSLSETERAKLKIEQEKRQIQFNETQRDLTEDEKERLWMRLFMLLKRDADNLNLRPEMDGGIADDFRKAYNSLRVKNGLHPIPTPAVNPGAEKPVVNQPEATIEQPKTKKSNVKKSKGKRGRKNEKNTGRDRKEEAAGGGNAVSSDEKLADGQG